jgi:ATP-dependent Lon protease
MPNRKRPRESVENPAIGMYSAEEFAVYMDMSAEDQRVIAQAEADNLSLEVASFVPLRFELLGKTMTVHDKRRVLKEIDAISMVSPEQGAKRRELVLTLLSIPFGIFRNPFSHADVFVVMERLAADLNVAVIGHSEAKRHIMRVVAQWISGPKTSGFVMGLHGPIGVGKTTLVEKGIARALQIPYSLLALGGVGDASYLHGHSYTYEGSTYGRIAGALMGAQCMNPLIFFDEVDKVSESSKGDEIINCLIHLTDTSQNHKFHDRYLGNYDLDMSRAVLIFSFNDRERVSPTLLDRMTVVETPGYSQSERKAILKEHMVPVATTMFNTEEATAIALTVPAFVDCIVQACPPEPGVRGLKRMLHDICAEANLLELTGAPVDVMSLVSKVAPKRPSLDTSLHMMYT